MKQELNNSKTIGIVGLGLIGGSLGLALQKLGYEVRGLTHRSNTATRAEERGLANLISTDPKILKSCSVVILALPLEQLLNPTQQLIKALPSDGIITDVGSVKEPVLKVWKDLHPKFVGSHPMTGTCKAGVDAGVDNLFKGKIWVTTPIASTDLKAHEIIKKLAISLGCQWKSVSPSDHDQAVALISHLPVLISAALLKTADNEKNASIAKLARLLASSGFADTTRVGGGNPTLGLSMMSKNTEAVLHFLDSYQESLKTLKHLITSENWNALKENFEKTNKIRSEFINH